MTEDWVWFPAGARYSSAKNPYHLWGFLSLLSNGCQV